MLQLASNTSDELALNEIEELVRPADA